MRQNTRIKFNKNKNKKTVEDIKKFSENIIW